MRRETKSHTESRSVSRRFADLVQRKGLLQPGAKLLTAVSGGPDSVALLALLLELAPSWNLDVRVLHVNHGLRGRESDEDERFVTRLGRRLGVPVMSERVSVAGSAATERKPSVQEAAREARYAALRRVAADVGSEVIALGHTADDQAETVLMGMLRGSGSRGLSGIPRIREGIFVRPLLDFRRTEILGYLEARGLDYRSDSSNAKRKYLRNRIRHELLPILQRVNPSIVDVLTRQAEILAEEDRWLADQTDECLDRVSSRLATGEIILDRSGFLRLPLALQRRALRALLCRMRASHKPPAFRTVTAVLEWVVHGSTGSVVNVRGGHLAREYDTVRFDGSAPAARVRPADVPPEGLPLPVPGELRWPPTGQVLRVTLLDAPGKARPRKPVEPRTRGHFDAERVPGELRVRAWQPGDTFQPAGMGGHWKKLQDFFSDLKVPRHDRRRIPLLVGTGGIVWVAGYRPDDRFCATASTKRILVVDLADHTS